MDKTLIHEFTTGDEVKGQGYDIPINYTWKGQMVEWNDVAKGISTRAVISETLPIIQKVETSAHELLSHSYRKSKGLPYEHGQKGVDVDTKKMESVARTNFNNFKNKWKFGKEEVYKHATKATDIGINKYHEDNNRREEILMNNIKYFSEKASDYYDFSIQEWDKYWRKINEKE